jgi:hypothetical protein
VSVRPVYQHNLSIRPYDLPVVFFLCKLLLTLEMSVKTKWLTTDEKMQILEGHKKTNASLRQLSEK